MAFYNTNTTQIGTKGSDVYTANGVDDPRVAFSALLVQGVDPTTISSGIDTILATKNKEMLRDLLLLLFQTRDIRGGKGIRDASQHIMKSLLLNDETQPIMLDLLDLVPEYGSWRDLKMLVLDTKEESSIYSTELEKRILQIFSAQLKKDYISDTPSLAAKYAPRECHESKEEKEFAKQMAFELMPSNLAKMSYRLRSYRRLVSSINRVIDTTEVKMCGKEFAEINPAKVAGRCLQKNMKAFLNQPSTYKNPKHPRPSTDPDRLECAEHFTEHFAKVARGEAKINGSKTVFPHELIKKVVHGMVRSRYYGDSPLEASMTSEEKDAVVGVWNQMVKDAKEGGGLGRSIAMCDFSGSMKCSGANGDTPYWVSMALGLLISEVTTEEFRNMFLTFDSEPTFHYLPAGDIFAKVASIGPHLAQGTSTDFQKAMDLVLEHMKRNRMRPGEEPENLIVLTDMNWDAAYGSHESSYYTGNRYRHNVKTDEWQTHVEMIRESFKRAGEDMWGEGNGLKMPRIVIWNIAATSSDFHARADTEGVVMLSGWSPSLFKVLQKEGVMIQTPYQALRCQLDDERYDLVRQRLTKWLSLE